MRRLLLLLTLLFCTFASFAQGIIGLLNKSEDFIDLLNQSKYEEARAFFDETMKSKVAPNTLIALWTGITGESGAYTGVDGKSSAREGQYVIVVLNCKFERGTETFRFVFDAAGTIAGLFRQPKSTAATYSPATYADTTKYMEKPVNLGPAPRTLAGIVTIPRKATNFPIVVLVHGSGPLDMDETVGPNKPFRDLAAGLAAQGIASLRYVKRSLIYPTDFSGAITVKEESINDAVAAIALAKTVAGVNKMQVYVLGHSLGGMLAPRIAAQVPDLAGLILAAAPARKMTDLLVEQSTNAFSAMKDTTAAGRRRFNELLKSLEITRIRQLGSFKPDSVLLYAPASYWIDLNQYDQVAAAKKFRNKIFVVQGQNDIQVSTEDFRLWKAGLAGKTNATFKLYPDLDHLLSPQPGKDWSGRYSRQVNVAGYLVTDIAVWIRQ